MLEILHYPHPVLVRDGEPIETIDDELRSRVAEMFETMYQARGVGLAAPQVGWSVRLFIVNPTAGEDCSAERVFINPEILSKQGREVAEEGCLSFPELTIHVPRAVRVVVRAQDLDGEWFEMEVEDLLARIIQHEYDHVLGILFISKMTPADRIAADKKLKELRAEARA